MKTIILIAILFFFNLSCQNSSLTKVTPMGKSIRGVAGAETQTSEIAQKTVIDENHVIGLAKQMSFVGPRSGEGYFSADGKKMVFQSEREPGNPFYQMYLLDLLSGKVDRLSPGQGKTTCGWVHPNMKTVLWSSTHLDSKTKAKVDEEYETRKKPVKGRYSWSFDDEFEIFSSDLHGKSIKQLTKIKGYDAEASYSGDGKWIAFASNRAGYTEALSDEDRKMFTQDPSYMMDIYIMKADGTNVQRLTTSKGYDGGPFFSADSKKITWRRFAPNGATAEIFTMNIDGSQQRPVTQLGSMSWAPFFHPSGDYIIFTSSVLGFANFELFIVDIEGSQKPVRVTFTDGFDGLPTFSPDGHQVSWTHRNEKGESQIYLADWDDSLARKLLKLPAKDLITTKFTPEISKNDIKDVVSYLSSQELAGRKTGSLEEKIYTANIASLFKSWGLVPAGDKGQFEQTFEFTSGVELGEKNSLEFVGSYAKSLKIQETYLPVSFSKTGVFPAAPISFAGYGIKSPATDKFPAYDSYKGLDVKGRWVVVFSDLPDGVTNEQRQNLIMYSRIQHKITVARNEGAVGVVVVAPENSKKDLLANLKFEGALSESTLPVLKVSFSEAENLLKAFNQSLKVLQEKLDKGGMIEPVLLSSVYLKAEVQLNFKKSKGINLLAKLKAPKNLSEATVLIGAHGDHLGRGEMGNSLAKMDEKGKVHPGADDNASGVSGVLELAHYYANLAKTNPKAAPKKDLLFAVWSGEEVGILGSTHFVKSWKDTHKKDLDQTLVAALNMDMIGRLKDRLQVQGVGSGDHWGSLSEEVTLRTGLSLTLQEDPYLPTDSMAIYLAKVPSITFFTGVHGEYHSPRDTADLINYEGIEKVLKVVKTYTDLLSDTSINMVKYLKVGGNPQGKLEGRTFRVYLGTVPDYSQEGIQGVLISGTSKDSPAEKAGLKEKDVIIEFDGKKIENLYDYVFMLQSIKPNVETTMKVRRQGAEVILKITPGLKE